MEIQAGPKGVRGSRSRCAQAAAISLVLLLAACAKPPVPAQTPGPTDRFNLTPTLPPVMIGDIYTPTDPNPSPAPTPSPLPPSAGEFRAFWVDGFHPGMRSSAEIDRLVQEMTAAHVNSVMVQVRRRADALYSKTHEPRIDELSAQPDLDPLAYLIEKAHAATPRLQVHAWINAMPVAFGDEMPTASDHLYYQHGPQAQGEAMWLTQTAEGRMTQEGRYYLDPGNPAAAQYLREICLNIVRNYDVDGIHLDFIRYPGVQFGYNPVAVARFN